jgi:hypothetical protein
MDGEDLVRGLASAQPRSWAALCAVIGRLDADLDGADWFHVYRHGLDGPLASASVEFDPFRGPGNDPPLARYLLVVRVAPARAAAALAGVPGFASDADDEGTVVRWEHREPAGPAVPFDAAVRDAFLAGLPDALAGAASAQELGAVTTPPPGAGVVRGAQPHQVRDADAELVPARAPSVTLTLSPAHDARSLATRWGIDRPVAVSTDAHLETWWMQRAGEVLADAYARRLATEHLRAGPWVVRIRLAHRPAGPPPGVVAGASPAYDVLERGGEVAGLEIEPASVIA